MQRLRALQRHRGGRRIVMVAHLHIAGLGGAEEVTRRLVGEWRSAGHGVVLVTYDDLPRVIRWRLRRLVFPYFVAYWLWQGRAGQLDIIDATTGDTWLYGKFRRRRAAVLAVRSHALEMLGEKAHQQELSANGQRPQWLRQLYYGRWMLWEVRASLRYADVVRLLSAEEHDFCVHELGLPVSKLRVAPNGISERWLAQDVATASDPIGIAVVGRWEALKGVATLVPALTAIVRAHPCTRVHLLGTGSAPVDVRQSFPADLQQMLNVVEAFDPSELEHHLRDCHIYVSASHTEGFSLALAQAMASGLAPVATRVGAAPGLLDDHPDLLFDVGDVDGCVERVVRLIRDREYLQQMRRAARERVSTLSWSNVAASTIDSYLDEGASTMLASSSGISPS
ncbi:MAG: glycosyltransferase family 4 protein [Actinomycetes bacterium]